MKILYFPKNIPCDSCFYVTVQKFKLLDYVMVLHAKILGMALIGLVMFLFSIILISGW